MTETIVAWVLLAVTLGTRDPAWAIASGVFAIAANVNLLYHKEGKA